MLSLLQKVWKDEEGQGMTEYILIVLLIAIAGIVVWRAFGDKIKDLVTGATDELGEVESDILGQ
ncbi:MAG: Flp family type IVb pilin [Deltaproteobacteria bacterium]|nr:MAG: Flp family type IVb pilin [Deltaproteobacteria bacterium]